MENFNLKLIRFQKQITMTLTPDEIELKREACLKKADEDYYDRDSPHYRDNIRFSWAVKTINEGFDKDLEFHNKTYENH